MADMRVGVYMESCLILDCRSGQSKAGNSYAVIRFLEQTNLDVYEVFCFGESMAVAGRLAKGSVYKLLWKLSPDNRGAGVQLHLIDCEIVQ